MKENSESIDHWPITESEFGARLKAFEFRDRFRAKILIYTIVFGPIGALLVLTGTESPSPWLRILMVALVFSPVFGLIALVVVKAQRVQMICPYCPTVLLESSALSELESSGTCSGCGQLLITDKSTGPNKSAMDKPDHVSS